MIKTPAITTALTKYRDAIFSGVRITIATQTMEPPAGQVLGFRLGYCQFCGSYVCFFYCLRLFFVYKQFFQE